MQDFGYIKENLARVKEELLSAARKSGTAPATLVAVTKSATDEEFLALMRLGIADFGENRVQNYRRRMELLAAEGLTPRAHLIGSLQKNKVKYIADSVSLIQSLDSLSLAEEIEKQAAKKDRRIPVLIEINSGREENKGGILPEDALAFARELSRFPHLSPTGLMTMGPDYDEPEQYRGVFRETRGLLLTLQADGLFDTKTPTLSMGMSDSYAVAAAEGATMVRVGRTLFHK